MKEICSKASCTGCAACMNRCPQQCIAMKEDDKLGHLFPQIDPTQCTDWGACVKVCPVHRTATLRQPLMAFAGWDKTEAAYVASTSGGAASAFARFMIRQGGVVYGCAMLPHMEVRHIRIERLEEVASLRGSKYVQSTMGMTYRQVRDDLRAGRQVLFIGTPCQVAGVKVFVGEALGQELYTADLICHGTPPLAYLRKHILKKTKNRVPDEIIFRKGAYLLLLLLCGREIYRSSLFEQRYEDTYYNAFFDGFSCRDSCHTCHYAQPNRVSDVTIGDFWGLKGELPLEHPHGCSVLLPTTEKGRELIEGIRPEFNLFERPVEEAVKGNDQLRHPKEKDWRISLFGKLLPLLGVDKAYKLCVADKIVRRRLRIIIKGK